MQTRTKLWLSFSNVLIGDPEHIYRRYLQAFKKGAFNYIKEEIDPLTQQPIPKKYFSGGVQLEMTDLSNPVMAIIHDQAMVHNSLLKSEFILSVEASPLNANIPGIEDRAQSVLTQEELDRLKSFSREYSEKYSDLADQMEFPGLKEEWGSVEKGVFSPSNIIISAEVLKLAGVKPGIKFVDAGGGDGRVALAASMLGAQATSIEYDSGLHALAEEMVKGLASNKERDRIKLIQGDIFKHNFSDADVVYYTFNEPYSIEHFLMRIIVIEHLVLAAIFIFLKGN